MLQNFKYYFGYFLFQLKVGIIMIEVIDYNSIAHKLRKRKEIHSSESDICFFSNDITKVYKIFKSELDAYELTLKNEKLKLLESKKINSSIVIPDAKIINPDLVGTRENYIDGLDLCYITLLYEIEDVLNILLNISKDLESIHQNDGIILSDLNFFNIRIDESKKHYFLDVLSYSIDGIPSNRICTYVAEYLKSKRVKVKASINNDKISFLMETISLLMDEDFFYITNYEFDRASEKIKWLKKLKDVYIDLKNHYVPEVPYLHELIK